MRHLVTPFFVPPRTAFLLCGCRPSPSWIQHIPLLKNVTISPITSHSNASHSNKQYTSTNSFEELRVLNSDWQKRLDEVHKQWLEETKQEHKQRLEETKQYTRQIVELENRARSTLEEKLRIENNFNVRGALEYIAFSAALQHLAPSKGGIQVKLNALAKTPDFQNVLTQVVTDRKLVLKDVESCIEKIYHEVSKHAHGNQEPITIPEKDFVPAEVAVLVAFMKLQDTWADPLSWKIEERK